MYFFRSSKEGSSGYSANSRAEQVTEGIDGTSLTAIVTGASSGIGAETARVFALRGVHVVMAVRNVDAGKKVMGEIVGGIANAKVDVMELDLSSMKSIRKFASEYVSSNLPLNILINNAGIVCNDKFRLSEDNIELTFATNHIGHFLLTNLLLDTMTSTTRVTKREGRIVNVSSSSHSRAPEIKFDRINDEQGIKGVFAYMRSKLANVLHANELARRLKAQGIEITANSLHPGIISTNIMRNHRYTGAIFYFFFKDKDIQQGAATQCYVALHPQLKGVSGKYFSDCNECEASCVATNEELGNKLWDFSISLTNNS